LKTIKPLVVWKKRKGDKAVPTKHDLLLKRWHETKQRADLSLEDFLRTTSLFPTYEKETGRKLTMIIILSKVNESGPKRDDHPQVQQEGRDNGTGEFEVMAKENLQYTIADDGRRHS